MTARDLHPFQKLVSALTIFMVGAALLTATARAAIVTGNIRDVSLRPYGGMVNTIQFTPLSCPQAIGTNTIWPVAVTQRLTNGAVNTYLEGGLYWVGIVEGSSSQTPKTIKILVPPNEGTNIWSLNTCANLATNGGTFMWTNNIFYSGTNIADGTISTNKLDTNAYALLMAGGGGGTTYTFTPTNLPVGSAWVTNGSVVIYPTNTSHLVLTNDSRALYLPNTTVGLAEYTVYVTNRVSYATNAETASIASVATNRPNGDALSILTTTNDVLGIMSGQGVITNNQTTANIGGLYIFPSAGINVVSVENLYPRGDVNESFPIMDAGDTIEGGFFALSEIYGRFVRTFNAYGLTNLQSTNLVGLVSTNNLPHNGNYLTNIQLAALPSNVLVDSATGSNHLAGLNVTNGAISAASATIAGLMTSQGINVNALSYIVTFSGTATFDGFRKGIKMASGQYIAWGSSSSPAFGTTSDIGITRTATNVLLITSTDYGNSTITATNAPCTLIVSGNIIVTNGITSPNGSVTATNFIGNASGLTNIQHLLFECGNVSNSIATANPGAATWHAITNVPLSLGNVTMAGWQVATNSLIYTNTASAMVHSAITLSYQQSQNATRTISFKVYKNGSPINSSMTRDTVNNSTDIESTALHPTFMASTGDVFQLWAMNNGTGDIMVVDMNWVVFSVK